MLYHNKKGVLSNNTCMKEIINIINSTPCESAADYLNLYKKIKRIPKEHTDSSEKFLKIALLSSFTIQNLAEILSVYCYRLGVTPLVYVSPYNQHAQEILNQGSKLYAFQPDMVILYIDIRTLFGEPFLTPYALSDQQRKQWTREKTEELVNCIHTMTKSLTSKIIVHNFEVPADSPLGILENKQEYGFVESIQSLNSALRDTFKSSSQVFILDYNAFCSKIGKQNICDPKMYYLADMKLDFQLMGRDERIVFFMIDSSNPAF